MNKIFLFFLFFLSVRVGFTQKIDINNLRTLLSEKIKVEDYLNSVNQSSIKYKKRLKNGRVIALVSIDSLRGAKETIKLDEVPFFLVSLSEKGNRIITWEEVELPKNFQFLADIKISSKDEYIIFYHLSSIGGFLEYYIVDSNTGEFYKTEALTDNRRIDYISFDFRKSDYIYYLGDTDVRKLGKINKINL